MLELVLPPEINLLLRDPCALARVAASAIEIGDAGRFLPLFDARLGVVW